MARTLDEILRDEELTDEEVKELPEIVNHTLPHLPVVILLDTSGSTAEHNAIHHISTAINGFLAKVVQAGDEFHRKLRRNGDFSIVRYGNGVVEPLLNWTAGENLSPSFKLNLVADGDTPMGAAIVKSADLLLDRYRGYKATGTRSFCGLVFNLTDGRPTDMDINGDAERQRMWKKAQDRVRLFETMGSSKNPYAQYIHFATTQESCDTLRAFAGDGPLYMPANSEDALKRVNLLQGADSFSRFVRYIEMSLTNIMKGSVDH
jgi:uncharacterized protein YegL